jgi:RNA polymerase sigma factor (sigma-70 family)
MGPPTGVTGTGVGRSFAQVLSAARADETWAYTALYRMCAPRVLGFVRARGVDDPEGVVNEAFLGAFRGLSAFEGDESAFLRWLFAITRNKVTDAHRRRARRREDPQLLGGELVGGDTEADAHDRMSAAWVRETLSCLTADQRDVLLLRVLGGLSIEEVAQAMGKRPGAVKALQHRAVRALRRQLSAGAVSR